MSNLNNKASSGLLIEGWLNLQQSRLETTVTFAHVCYTKNPQIPPPYEVSVGLTLSGAEMYAIRKHGWQLASIIFEDGLSEDEQQTLIKNTINTLTLLMVT